MKVVQKTTNRNSSPASSVPKRKTTLQLRTCHRHFVPFLQSWTPSNNPWSSSSMLGDVVSKKSLQGKGSLFVTSFRGDPQCKNVFSDFGAEKTTPNPFAQQSWVSRMSLLLLLSCQASETGMVKASTLGHGSAPKSCPVTRILEGFWMFLGVLRYASVSCKHTKSKFGFSSTGC